MSSEGGRIATVLIIEEESPQVRLLAWALEQEKLHDVLVAARLSAEEKQAGVAPDFIVLNTHMTTAEKREWVAMLRHLVRGARIIDLLDSSRTIHDDHDTGADAYVGPPYVETLLSTINGIAGRVADEQGASQ